jgi:hypothetical protein
MLKQQTAAARQFRAAEFEYGCIEARRAGLLPPTPVQRGLGGAVNDLDQAASSTNEFEEYMNHNAP